MALFGKKEEEAPKGPPVDLVLQMRAQGLSNNQIVQTLQRQGIKSHEIFDAMNQADMKGSVEQVPPEAGGPAEPENPMEAKPEPVAQQPAAPPADIPPMPAPQAEAIDEDKVEEIAEAIIEEKWEELIKNVNKIIDWKEQTETRLVKIEDGMEHLKHGFDELNKGILGKMGDYETSISQIGTEIKALEKVFQKILPTFTDNINELGRITNKMKKK